MFANIKIMPNKMFANIKTSSKWMCGNTIEPIRAG
jgi:hypothetical protein